MSTRDVGESIRYIGMENIDIQLRQDRRDMLRGFGDGNGLWCCGNFASGNGVLKFNVFMPLNALKLARCQLAIFFALDKS